jgi:hypothetical protein
MASILRRSRIQRWFVSLSEVAVTLIGLFVAWLLKGSSILYIVLPALVIVLTLVAKTCFQYQNRTYDPTWALRFQAVFDGMQDKRKKAAEAILRHNADRKNIDAHMDELSDVDDVLDFLEDIGFYVKGGQISAEVAHHHFYHWIRGYWKASRDYIEAWQRSEPTRWEYVGDLFETTRDVEIARTKGSKEQELEGGIVTFLNEEI